VNSRFAGVNAVLSFARSQCREQDKPDLRRVVDLVADNLKKLAVEENPSPIEPKHFRALLAQASIRDKAIMLLGLNGLMHGGEAPSTLVADINWQDGTLRARRTKVRKPRVAVLWQRTLDAIKAYQQAHPHQSEYLFVANNGKPMTSECFRQRVVEYRRRAKLPKHVTFEGVRDAGYGMAEETDRERAKWIAGHSTGMKDKYILRLPDKPSIRKCCQAIEKHFFGGKK
jgi:integrase